MKIKIPQQLIKSNLPLALISIAALMLWAACSKPKPEPVPYSPPQPEIILDDEPSEEGTKDTLDTNIPVPEGERGGSTSTENN